MKKFDFVSQVECKRRDGENGKYRCWINHGDEVQSEVDVDGIMVKGRSVVSGDKTEVMFDQAECRIYNGVLVCKDKSRNDNLPDLE